MFLLFFVYNKILYTIVVSTKILLSGPPVTPKLYQRIPDVTIPQLLYHREEIIEDTPGPVVSMFIHAVEWHLETLPTMADAIPLHT